MERAIKTWVTGLRFRPFSAISANSFSLSAIPPPVPPMVNAGRMITGNPILSANSCASWTLLAMADSGTGSCNFCIRFLNNSRSSAWSMALNLVPSNSIPSSSKMPVLLSFIARFNPIWPPMVGKMASGNSLRKI